MGLEHTALVCVTKKTQLIRAWSSTERYKDANSQTSAENILLAHITLGTHAFPESLRIGIDSKT